MLLDTEKYRLMIKEATETLILFPKINNQGEKPFLIRQSDIKLSLLYTCRSSEQIDKNIPITWKQTSKQHPITLQNEWPKSCIGLILCEHQQNNQTFYVYGTGTLIHNSIVLTSAQNVYCRRLHKQYTNIRFITGVSGEKCSGIYDIKRVHYPKQYTMQEYQNYNFAVLQLYDDLSNTCGYVQLKTLTEIQKVDNELTEYGYLSNNKEVSLKQRQLTKSQKQEIGFDSVVFMKENENKQFIVGLKSTSQSRSCHVLLLNQKIINIINQWTHSIALELPSYNISVQGSMYLSKDSFKQFTTINLVGNNIGVQGCKYLIQSKWIHLNTINLASNKIGAQGCKYLSQTNWIHLNRIILSQNEIGTQGCKYISKTNWIYLTTINLMRNSISAQGCKYLSYSNWIHLTTIELYDNTFGVNGCKYLNQANWAHLTTLNLILNNIGTQGCKYLSQAKWTNLTIAYLSNNNIGVQGCKYLVHANWPHLTQIYLWQNNIDVQGVKYLSQSNWMYLIKIQLVDNKMSEQGCKYLSQCNWIHLLNINLMFNSFSTIKGRVLEQLWPKANIIY